MSRLLRRLGGRCAAHPVAVIGAWTLVTAGLSVLAATVGGSLTAQKSLPGTEVAAADGLLRAHHPAASHDSAQVVLHDRRPAALRAAVAPVTTAAQRLPHVESVTAPAVSADGTTAALTVTYDVPRFLLGAGDLRALQRTARSAGVEGHVGGLLFLDLNTPSSGLGEKVGVGVALLVLLVAFGSVVAALMPVAVAGVAILAGLALVRLLAAVHPISDSAPALATMLGLGVGIDYALFIVTRHREAMRAGVEPDDAAAAATASAGGSVLWAGITVVAAICGLAFAGIPLVTSLGFASAIVVATTVVAALTLLPALLGLTGRRLDRLRIHRQGHRAGYVEAPGRVVGWARWAAGIERRPLRYALGAAAALALLAVPTAGMRLGMPDGSAAPRGSEAQRTFELLSAGFGAGANGPLQIVVTVPPGAAARTVDELGLAVRDAATRDGGVLSAGPMRLSPDRRVGVVTVTPTTGPQAAQTAELVTRLRDDRLPPVERSTGARALVTGLAAGRADVAARVLDRLPWFVGAVLAVSFLLLMVVFRSLLVPLKAVLLNLLSIAAALGVVVAVFTWGWLRQVVGVPETVPIVDVIPMLMFAIVFGLSMDYEVFLLSRVREEWLLDRDSRGSVVRGLTSTARVISAAAAIMVCVFLAFTLSSDVVVKMMGLGLAVAVFLDATLIRLVLVPATMALLGDRNWWLPRWLDRLLPHVDVNAAVPLTPYAGQTTHVPTARPTA